MKRSLLLAIIGVVVVVLIGGGIIAYQMTRTDDKSTQTSEMNGTDTKSTQNKLPLTVNFSTPIGDQVPQTVIQDIINEPISNVQPTTGNITNVCKYYLNEKDYVTLRLNKLNYDTQKAGNERSGAKISEDHSINAEHFIVTAPNGPMANISIKITDTLILTVERSSQSAISDKKFIDLAAGVVKYLQNSTSTNTNGSKSGGTNDTGDSVTKLDDREFITNFFKLINDGKASEAVMIMTSKNTGNDSTKQAWAVQFNAMKSITVSGVEAYNESSWTTSQREYKVTFNLTMDPNSANAPIPYYGYENGKNTRFVILAKEDGAWKIDGIATGP